MTISLQICYNELEIIFIILETNYSVRFLFYVTIIIMLNDDLWLNVGSKYNYWKALNIDLLGKKIIWWIFGDQCIMHCQFNSL